MASELNASLVVLAAGMGSRYGGLKQMDKFGPNGENIIDYSIYDAIRAGFERIVFVVRKNFLEDFRKFYGGKFENRAEIVYVTQELDDLPEGYRAPEGRVKPWGTAHAVLVARDAVNGPFAVINADDFYGRDAYVQLIRFFRSESQKDKQNYCVIGYHIDNTLSDHGTVNRGVCKVDDDHNLLSIEECVRISKHPDGTITFPGQNGGVRTLSHADVVSMNIWGFFPSYFTYAREMFIHFLKEKRTVPKSEFYIPDVVDQLIRKHILQVKVLPSESEWFGVTYQEDKPFVMDKINNLISSGTYPEALWDVRK